MRALNPSASLFMRSGYVAARVLTLCACAQPLRKAIREHLDRLLHFAITRSEHMRYRRVYAVDLLHDDSRLWSSPSAAALDPAATILEVPGKPSLLKWLHAIGMHEVYPQLAQRQHEYCYRRAEDIIDDLVLSAEHRAKLWFELSRLRALALSSGGSSFQLNSPSSPPSATASGDSKCDVRIDIERKSAAANGDAKIGDLASLERFIDESPLLGMIVQQKRDEDSLRALFVQEPDHEAVRDRHVLLRNLYPSSEVKTGAFLRPP